MNDTRTVYEYNAETRIAKVYSPSTGACILTVPDVSAEIGRLLHTVNQQAFKDGAIAGRDQVKYAIEKTLDRLT